MRVMEGFGLIEVLLNDREATSKARTWMTVLATESVLRPSYPRTLRTSINGLAISFSFTTIGQKTCLLQ